MRAARRHPTRPRALRSVGLAWILLVACDAPPEAEGPGQSPETPTHSPATAQPEARDAEARAVDDDAPDPWAREGLEALRPAPAIRWPLEAVHLTSYFGWRYDPVAGAGYRLHRGIDLRGATGDIVISVAAGRVRFAGHDPLLGNLVIVDHRGGLSSWYAHLSSIGVHAGLPVARGTALGAVGNTGRSAAPHLHLTFKLGQLAVDPLAWID